MCRILADPSSKLYRPHCEVASGMLAVQIHCNLLVEAQWRRVLPLSQLYDAVASRLNFVIPNQCARQTTVAVQYLGAHFTRCCEHSLGIMMSFHYLHQLRHRPF